MPPPAAALEAPAPGPLRAWARKGLWSRFRTRWRLTASKGGQRWQKLQAGPFVQPLEWKKAQGLHLPASWYRLPSESNPSEPATASMARPRSEGELAIWGQPARCRDGETAPPHRAKKR